MSIAYNNVSDLENKIKVYAEKYYLGNPEISDEEFDNLVDTLREINPSSAILKSVGWGSGVENKKGKKVSHKYQTIGSLDKIKAVKNIPDYSYPVISAKLDGLSAVMYYNNGNLERAVTRGNGVEGIDITDKIVRILGNRKLKTEFTGAVRGELVISINNWNLMKENDSSLKNPRNTAAGIINRDEITDDIEYVSIVVYNVIGSETNSEFYSQRSIYDFLMYNFNTVCPHVFCDSMMDITEEYLTMTYENFRNMYPCDGLVIGNERLTILDNKACHYSQIAYKFPAEIKESKVTDIKWNLTRTGKMVPTIEFESIELSGATVSRCSGFNAKFISDNKVCKDSVITIMRSGEVIPDLQKVVYTPGNDSVPTVCPVCGSKLKWSGVDVVCDNPECASREYRDLECWINNIGKVDGISTTLKFKFLDELGVKSVDYLYNKRYTLSGDGTQRDLFRKVLSKLYDESIDIVDALCALNIPRLGRTTASKMAVDKKMVISLAHEACVNGVITTDISNIVGQATMKSIMSHSSKFSRLVYIENMIDMSEKSVVDNTSAIKVAVTGSLSVKRSVFEKMLSDNGFVLTGVKKDTMYLITDDPNSGSSKNKLADKLGVKKVTEQEFREIYGL